MRPAVLALLLVLSSAAGEPALAGGGNVGARLYTERCSGCHGDDGKGDGPAAAALSPPPRNFHDAVFWHDRTVNDLKAVVRKGKPGTMMPPFAGVLTEAEIDAVATYLTRFDPARETKTK